MTHMSPRMHAVVVALAAFSVGLASPLAASADAYKSPQAQLSEGTFPLAVQCNEPRELYLRESHDLLCLYKPTYEALLQRGSDMIAAESGAETHKVTIGMLAPLGGGAAGYGQDISAAFTVAINDINASLAEAGEAWRLEGSMYDTMTDSDTAMESIMEINNRGIKIVAGPSIDLLDPDMIKYADDNGMLLFSCCSEANSNKIDDDSLLRMIPDQSVRAGILADAISDAGIGVIVPVVRDSEWASGTAKFVAERITEAGGQAKEAIAYETFDDSHVRGLADGVRDAIASSSASEVAVLYIGFEETYDFIEAASAHGVLSEVRWFGADANTILHDNPAGLAFAEGVGFTVIEPALPDSKISARVAGQISDALGRQPSIYAMFAYDVVQLIGLSMQEAQTSNPATIAETIMGIAAGHEGASGSNIAFDSAGDRTGTEYALFEITSGIWSETSRHKAMPENALGLTDQEVSWLEANTIRFAYDPDWAPVEYRGADGNVAGLTKTYVDQFEAITGKEMEQLDVGSWSKVLEAMKDGDADVLFMIVDTAERRDELNLDFTSPHTTISTDIVSIGERSYSIEDLADIRPVTIRNYEIETWLDHNHPDVQYVSVDSFEEGLAMLQSGNADAFLDRFETIVYHSDGLEGLHSSGPTGHAYHLSIAYSSDNQTLGSIMQKVQDVISATAIVP